MFRRLSRLAACFPLLAVINASLTAQVASSSSDAGLPLQPTRTVRFTTDEGTWMFVDITPDGRTLVVDILGDLYSIPASGGKATRLTSGMSYDMHPAISPDGRQIA